VSGLVEGPRSVRAGAGGRPAPRARAPVPEDEALPHLSRALDVDAMAEIIRPLLKTGSSLELSIKGLRYQPAQRLSVHYQLGEREGWSDAVLVMGAGDYGSRVASPEHQTLAKAVGDRSPALSPIARIRELDAMLFFLPLDPSLPALAEPPDAMWRRLEDAGLPLPSERSEPLPLGYRARRRAVVKVADHVLKFYASPDSFARAAEGLQMTSGLGRVRTAPFEAALPKARVTAQAFIQGATPPPSLDTSERVGTLLAEFHAVVPLAPWLPDSRQMHKAARRAELLCAIAPAMRRRVGALVETLVATEPRDGRPVACHGDMHRRQLLDLGERFAMIDFDSMCAAPPALDLAAYAGRAVRRSLGDLHVAVETLDALVRGYGRRPPALGWFLSTYLLRRAPSSFRHMDAEWMERVEAMVRAAEEALRL
jgi:thiamine kinase-like enzyme